MGRWTPWGESDHVTKYGKGVAFYGTPGHGGYHVSPTMLSKMHPALAALGEGRDKGWFEEDCAYAAVQFTWPELFVTAWDSLATAKANAARVLKDYWPDAYAAATGEVVKLEESAKLRERAFCETNANKYVGVSACGSWQAGVPEGMVGVTCVRGGRRPDGRYASTDERGFLVPEAEYSTKSRYGFVVEDESRYAPFVNEGRLSKAV
jgi:hypothetical protein